MYLGMALILLGYCTYLGNPASLVGVAAFCTYITRFQIIPEERLLLGKFGEPSYEAAAPVQLGRARVLRAGERVAILTTGEMAPVALAALPALAANGRTPLVCQFHTIQPLDTAALEQLAAQARTFIVVEEAAPEGALFSGVRNWNHATGGRVQLVRLGPGPDFVLGNPVREAYRQAAGFDAAAIAAACRAAWK